MKRQVTIDVGDQGHFHHMEVPTEMHACKIKALDYSTKKIVCECGCAFSYFTTDDEKHTIDIVKAIQTEWEKAEALAIDKEAEDIAAVEDQAFAQLCKEKATSRTLEESHKQLAEEAKRAIIEEEDRKTSQNIGDQKSIASVPIIYCSCPILGMEGEVQEWIPQLEALSKETGKFLVYNPWRPFADMHKDNPLLWEVSLGYAIKTLSDRLKNIQANAMLNILRLPQHLLMPYETKEIQELIKWGDEGDYAAEVDLKDTYVLLRASMMLVDLNEPSHGGVGVEVTLAHILRMPIVGVSHRFHHSPQMVRRAPTIVTPKTANDLVEVILNKLRM